MYWNIHRHLPKSFRLTTSEDILKEITHCVKCVILANNSDKKQIKKREQASDALGLVRMSLMTARGLMTLGWNMKFISHGAFINLTDLLNGIEKQATRWQAWFDDFNQ